MDVKLIKVMPRNGVKLQVESYYFRRGKKVVGHLISNDSEIVREILKLCGQEKPQEGESR